VIKNWLNDFRVDCKNPFSLVELVEIDAYLEKKLKKFEETFERDEVVKI
jgi:hypothetical protein